jgi:hypothetical protein
MDRRQSVIANVKYQSAKGKGAGKLKGILRYIQYRNDRDGHIPQERDLERWVDHGLGGNFQTIASNCETFKSKHFQAFTLVINPNPDLVAFIPEDRRDNFVRELTENTIEGFFAERGLDTPEWSYAMHHRETTDDGRDNPHTHVILPGTYESWSDGGRLPLYFNNRKNENHIEMLHEAAQQELGLLLDHYVGPDWEQRYDELHPEVDSQELELQQIADVEELPPAPDDHPHLTVHHDGVGEDIHARVAIQGDIDPDLYHVGFIIRGEGEQIHNQVFNPKAENLTKDQAETLAEYMKQLMQIGNIDGYTRAGQLADLIHQTNEQDRDKTLQIFEPVFNGDELDIDNPSPGLDL